MKGTYFQNSESAPLVWGDIEIKNPERKRLRGEESKKGILAETVIVGFCGTDFELMKMGKAGKLDAKFPKGENRLINGHEGVVYVPSEDRFAIVLIRGGNSYDPTRFTEEEDYFEYGCDGADGLMCDMDYYNPDMLLPIPDKYIKDGKIDLSVAKRLVFSDPYSCMIFQLERMEDLGSAHNFRVEMARTGCSEAEARDAAKKKVFDKTVIFGLGTTGMFIADIIKQSYPEANIVFVARSAEDSSKVKFALEKTGAEYVENRYESDELLASAIEERLGSKASLFIGASGSAAEHRIAFEYGVLGCNGIYNSFSLGPRVEYDTMPFGFKNQLIFGSINFRQDHMEKAIRILCESDYDRIVELIDKDEFISDPIGAYCNKIYAKGAPMKTAMIWNEKYISR